MTDGRIPVRPSVVVLAFVSLAIAPFAISARLTRQLSGSPGGTLVYFTGERIRLPAGVTATCPAGGSGCQVLGTTDVTDAGAQFLAFSKGGKYDVALVGPQGKSSLEVGVVPVWATFPACAGLLLLIFGGPAFLRAITGRTEMTWAFLLSEANGGFSLAKMQLAVWWIPAIVIVGGVFAVKLENTTVPVTFAVLLGLSGATTALGAATSPSAFGKPTLRLVPETPFPKAASEYGAAREVDERVTERPELTDLVSDWQNQGDFSRYQYLVMSVIGSMVIAVAFFIDGRLVEIPKEFLALIGASQATYLGTKAVKAVKGSTEGTSLAA